jgi:hypothetical protein
MATLRDRIAVPRCKLCVFPVPSWHCNCSTRVRLRSNREVLVRGPIALVAFVVLSICILAPRSAAVLQSSAPSPEVALGGGALPARMHARASRGSGDSERLELAGALTLQGVLFLALGFLWTNWSRRKRSHPTKAVGHQEPIKQSVSDADVENSPVGVASVSS